MIAAWRGRLELLGLLVAVGVLIAAVGFHVFAIAQVEPYTTALREISLLENAALAVATVVCLVVILLPGLTLDAPPSRSAGVAVTALIITAIAAALVAIIGVVAAVGGISEVRLKDVERTVSTTTPEAWAYVAFGVGTAIIAIACFVYAVMGAAATQRSQRTESVVPLQESVPQQRSAPLFAPPKPPPPPVS